MKSIVRAMCPLLIVLLFVGLLRLVGLIPAIPLDSVANAPLPCENSHQGKTFVRCEVLPEVAVPRADMRSNRDSNRPFVGVAISGGGSRSANFGAAVLEQLDGLGMLDHVSAISSVSGGSLPAAYFALNGAKAAPEAFWPDLRAHMAEDFLWEWTKRYLRPDGLLRTFFTHFDRSDIMAGVFEDHLFGNATFKDLGDPGERRPLLLVNATLSRLEQHRFVFTPQDMRRIANSRLDTYPVSRAVMASAAFPGVFSYVTLELFSVKPKATVDPKSSSYEHLLDGGAGDNLGLLTLLDAAREHFGSQDSKVNEAQCLLILVDAHVHNPAGFYSHDAEPRGEWWHFLIDPSLMGGIDPLFVSSRFESLRMAGLTETTGPVLGRRAGTPSVQARARIGRVSLSPELTQRRFYSPHIVKDKGYCTVWHLGLNELAGSGAIVTSADGAQRDLRLEWPWVKGWDPAMELRLDLAALVRQVETNFRLSGPENCEPAAIQSALYAAARVLVVDDVESRKSICDWFNAAGRTVSDSCSGPVPSLGAAPLDATFPKFEVQTRGGQRLVACKSAGTDR